MEKMIRTYVNFIKEDWYLFLAFSLAAAQMDPNDKKNQFLGHGSGTSNCHRPNVLEMGRPDIRCYIGNKSNKIHSHKKERHIID